MLLACLLIGTDAGGAAPAERQVLPTSEGRFEALGEPLERVLSRLSETAPVRLEAGRELKAQRVTVLISISRTKTIDAALAELLSTDSEAKVVWDPVGAGVKRLAETLKLRQLRQSLSDLDVRLYREHLEREVQWLENEAARELAAAEAENPGILAALRERMAIAGLLRAIGDGGRSLLLQGKPLYARLGSLAPKLKTTFREYLLFRRPDRASQTLEQLDDGCDYRIRQFARERDIRAEL
jgi:hypothetical protein